MLYLINGTANSGLFHHLEMTFVVSQKRGKRMISTKELEQVKNTIVFDSFIKAMSVLKKHKKIMVTISGGSDSDLVLDIIEKCKTEDNDVHYVWFDTGLEYQATKDHLVYLEEKYGITIEREKAKKPIPTCCKEFGQPFLSKYVSEMLARLKRAGFKWEDKSYEELLREYPNEKTGVRWWCSWYLEQRHFSYPSQFDVRRNKWLKEFLIKNPPTFDISSKCCTYAKKKVSKEYTKNLKADLIVIGVRQAEGGIRATAYKNCYSHNSKQHADQYRPIFWYTDEDKAYYEEHFGIRHSDCYTKYGLRRTGCVGCPYNRNIDEDMKAIQAYEPKLAKACEKIFNDAYEYTRAYRTFYSVMQEKEKHQMEGQKTLYDV